MIAPSRLLLALSLAAPSLVASQQPAPRQPAPARPRGASLVGTVADSLHGGPLAGATVLLDGASRMAVTDSSGGFRIDSVPPGSWRLGIFHPLLDSLGLSVSTEPMPFTADSVPRIALSTPTIAQLAEGWCAPAARRLGPGALIGRVLDAESGEGLAGVRTSLVYEEAVMVGSLAVRRMPRVRTAAADSGGRFALCGLPPSMTGTLQVERPGSRTPEIPITLDDNGYGMRVVLLARAAVAQAPGAGAPARLRGTASVRGRVTGPDRRPVGGARVTVEGTGAEATTDASGAFSIGELPAGTWTVLARRVGTRPGQQVVSLAPHRPSDVALVLEPVTELEAVVVRDTVARGLQRVGFTARRGSGMGHYLTPEQIADRRPNQTTELLRTMPGIQVSVDARGNSHITSSRDAGRGCIEVYVDGMPSLSGGTDLDDQVPANEVAAVEVYPAGQAPAEFTRAGRGTCGAVVVWTKTKTRATR